MRSIYEKIKNDRLNNAREILGVIVAVQTLWFDSKLEAALGSFGGGASQLVLVGAAQNQNLNQIYLLTCRNGYKTDRLSCLKESSVFEVDYAEVLQLKTNILEAEANSKDDHQHPIMTAKSVRRVAAYLTEDDWFEKLQMLESEPKKNTVWVLDYLSHTDAMKVLKTIADK
ncbi:S-adenosyl-L-methionine-dependent methyltransferase MMAR_1068 [Olea europaea subsp. europaea]|uniref:S-adenosyl-L-methionine-dependent methyltransferase MMAR_1068 n=1 Tax=Olea europaea subsp. europaea TaxID=158383 RepID=A0A8S0VKD9_OLEEU|nr:S-adenosyl-L-methionine-dependent methyltransferase MMAR_1068 [Olea europaea subsp. europaea]